MDSLPNFNSGVERGRHITKSRIYWGIEINLFLRQVVSAVKRTVFFVDKNFDLEGTLGFYQDSDTIVVKSEPSRKQLQKILNQFDEAPLNIVAIGGGSTIDLAKAFTCARKFRTAQRIGYGPLESTNSDFSPREDILVAIPTTLGSGSESSRYFVLFEDDGRKLPSRSWQAIPDFVLLYPALLRYLDSDTAIYQLFDAYIHSVEVASSVHEGFIPTVATSIALARQFEDWLTSSNFSPAIDDSSILELQLLSSLTGQCISNTRTGLLHTFGEILSEFFQINHVTSLALCGVNFNQFLGTQTRYVDSPIMASMRKSLRNNWEFISIYSQRVLAIDKSLVLLKTSLPSADYLVHKLLTDRVLWTKEFPFKVTEKEIVSYVNLTYELLRKKVN